MCVCPSVCLFMSLFKATNHNWFKNAWNFPNRLYLMFTVLRVRAGHPCRGCGSSPGACVWVYK